MFIYDNFDGTEENGNLAVPPIAYIIFAYTK